MSISTPYVSIQNLQKIYTIHEREAGLGAAMRSLIKRKSKEVRAVTVAGWKMHSVLRS